MVARNREMGYDFLVTKAKVQDYWKNWEEMTMIFADKLVQLRKKSGWSQEELAEQMKVTRQSVSKWEGAQSIPDLAKMVQLSNLFGVSLDYLLKDEIEELEPAAPAEKGEEKARWVSLEEANGFLEAKTQTAGKIAWATFLCIISPITMLILGAASETPGYGITEDMAGGIGMIVMLILVAAAVAVYISCGHRTEPYQYLEKELFETEYGVEGMVRERRENFRAYYTKNNIIGTCLCILALVPLFGGLIISQKDLFLVIMLSLMFVIVGVGVVCFIRVGIIWVSFEKLLQEGDYSHQQKLKNPIITAISVAYWCIAAAVYVVFSFATDSWSDSSRVVWPVSGVLYGAVRVILSAVEKKSQVRDR